MVSWTRPTFGPKWGMWAYVFPNQWKCLILFGSHILYIEGIFAEVFRDYTAIFGNLTPSKTYH